MELFGVSSIRAADIVGRERLFQVTGRYDFPNAASKDIGKMVWAQFFDLGVSG